MNKIFNWATIKKDDDQSSYQIIYVPTFKSYCIGVETLGRITVSIKHQSKLLAECFNENKMFFFRL
jgi:hypothetical protein